MSYSITFRDEQGGTDGPFSLATTAGWADVGRWAASLPAGRYPAVTRFLAAGRYAGTDALAAQLSEALGAHPPDDDTAHTVKNLLELIGVGDPGESARVIA